MSRPILLDLFCCEGGAARGYQQAGFLVLGVDLSPKFAKRYAGDGFLAADALDLLDRLLAGLSATFTMRDGTALTVTMRDLHAIHASPPCQRYSITNAARRHDYPDLVGPVRQRLQLTALPWVIENVPGAPLVDPVVLCWSHFHAPGSVRDTDGEPLRMERHRLFETNVPLAPPGACAHPDSVQVAGAYGGARREGATPAERRHNARHKRRGGYVPDKSVQQALLGIDWMTLHGMWQSLPPVYTEHVGRALLGAAEERAA